MRLGHSLMLSAVISGKATEPDGKSHSMIIAPAGDWTKNTIRDASSGRDITYYVRLIRAPGLPASMPGATDSAQSPSTTRWAPRIHVHDSHVEQYHCGGNWSRHSASAALCAAIDSTAHVHCVGYQKVRLDALPPRVSVPQMLHCCASCRPSNFGPALDVLARLPKDKVYVHDTATQVRCPCFSNRCHPIC